MGIAARRIPTTTPDEWRYELTLPTNLGQVGEAVEAVVACCADHPPLSSRTRFRIRTVAAEAIANAMCYGNGNDPARRVVVEVHLDPTAIRVRVSDEGCGFDPTRFREFSEPESHEATTGRGLFLIRRLADHVEFNARGNTIWMTLPRH